MPTPPEPGESYDRPVLEPIRVLRPRRTDALAELFRELTQDQPPLGYDSVPVSGRPSAAEEETQELPPVTTDEPRRRGGGGGPGLRRAALTVGVCAAALVGFAGALLLPGRGGQAAAQTPPSASAPAPTPTPTPTSTAAASEPTDPDGAGTLREGDRGPEVTGLQERLRRIPDVYDDGATDGRYDSVLTEAVARFQLWYGIRGDETGVYGDDTRRDLESRTG